MTVRKILSRIDFALCRRFPYYNKLTHQSIRVQHVGDRNKIDIHPSCIFDKLKVVVRGNNNIVKIEKECNLGSNALIFITGDNNVLSIGEHSLFSGETRFVLDEGRKIKIGNHCLFGIQVCLRTSDGHPIFNEDGERINFPDDITIADHVWIGQRTTILKGVTIGQNSMVGTMSLVTKCFEDNSMVAGIPARLLKSGINWTFDLY